MSISNTGLSGIVAAAGNVLGDLVSGPKNTYANLRAIQLHHELGAQRAQQDAENNFERIKLEAAAGIVRDRYKTQAATEGKLKEAREMQSTHMRNTKFALKNLDKGVAYNNRNLSVNPIKPPSSSNTSSTITAAQKAIHDHVAKMRNPRISQATLDSHMKQVVQLHGGDKRKVNSLIKARLASHRPGTPLPVR